MPILRIRMHSSGKLLCAVRFIQNVVSQRLQIGEVGAVMDHDMKKDVSYVASKSLLEKGAPQSAKVRVFWIVHLGDAPRVDPSTNGLTIDFDFLLRTNDGKRKKSLCLT
jgi:hypothetical protein